MLSPSFVRNYFCKLQVLHEDKNIGYVIWQQKINIFDTQVLLYYLYFVNTVPIMSLNMQVKSNEGNKPDPSFLPEISKLDT